MAKHPTLAALSELQCPTLALVTTTYGQDTTVSWLNTLMEDLFSFTEQQKGVTPERIHESCEIICTSYPYLNLFEVLYFFALCKRAEFGTFFGTTGPIQVANMLRQFLAQRDTSIANAEYHRHTERAHAPKRNDYLAYLEYLENRPDDGNPIIQEIKQRHLKK